MCERGVEDAAFAVGAYPGDSIVAIRALLSARLGGDLVAHVQRDQNPQLGAVIERRLLLIDFIAPFKFGFGE